MNNYVILWLCMQWNLWIIDIHASWHIFPQCPPVVSEWGQRGQSRGTTGPAVPPHLPRGIPGDAEALRRPPGGAVSGRPGKQGNRETAGREVRQTGVGSHASGLPSFSGQPSRLYSPLLLRTAGQPHLVFYGHSLWNRSVYRLCNLVRISGLYSGL